MQPLTHVHAHSSSPPPAVTRKSEQLVFGSRLYEKRSQGLNTKLFWRKWAPAIIVAVILLLVVYLRFFWFYWTSTINAHTQHSFSLLI
jgi:anti-sigma-K factor RskA